jgi:cephalosporin-C deacetylase-like acetyl esterase
MIVNSELCHDLLVEKTLPKLSYSNAVEFETWKMQIKEKFIELSGLDEIAKNACPLNLQIKSKEKKDGYTLIRFTFDSEVGESVPCYLCIPDTGKGKYPVAITLQGHSSGAHNSIGEIKYKQDEDYQPRGQFALQAVENGFIALAIEQRGMGIKKPKKSNRLPECMCQYASRVALGLGRTIIGERVWDIHKAIDALESYFPACDMDKILITGNSGGGTASYYAACYDERIKISAPSCSFCSYKESILSIAHCACNYIPFMYKYFDMQDLACMIAPRNLLLIAGKEDDIFPIDGVRRGYETVQAIYEKNGVKENCRLVETPKGHWWCVDIVWKAIQEECEKLGWR